MSTVRARARLAEQKRKKREWESVISAPQFQNGGYYEGGITAVDHSGSVKRCGQCTFDQVKVPKSNRVRRCKVRSCVDSMCWHHLRKTQHLRVKPSTLPGLSSASSKGLFTETEITVPRDPKKAYKLPYNGFFVNRDVATRKDYRSDYLAAVRGKKYHVDGKMSNASAARYINACKPAQKAAGQCKNNMTLYYVPASNQHYVKAIHRIPAGGELFMAYGAQYWQPDSPASPASKPHRTTPRKVKIPAPRNYDLDPSIDNGKREVD